MSTQKNGALLVVATNHDTYPSRKKSTGLWLGELVHFMEPVEEAGYDLEFVSPEGGEVPLDETSLSRLMSDSTCRKYLEDPDFLRRLKETTPLSDVDWHDYDGIYLAGGHGTMWDFPGSRELREITGHLFDDGRVVAAVCHGVCGLLDVTLANGERLVDGRRITGFSNLEETISRLADEVPFLLQDELVSRGAIYEKALIPFMSKSVVDGRLITGQNPGSTKAVAQATLTALASN